MANKVTIEVEARFKDEVSGKTKYVVSGLEQIEDAAQGAQKGLNNLGKKKVNPIIDADNNKFLKKMQESDSKLAKIAGKTATATLKVLDKGTDIVNKLESGLKKVVSKTWTTVVKIKDLATAPLKTLKNTLFSIKSLVMAITAGLAAKQFVLNPINLADAYSSAQIGFSTLLGETGGQAMMDEIDAFAKATPFKTSGVISNVQKMMAYGWDVERVIEDMKTIGDAAAATGKGDEGLASIVYALSEIRSKGKLSTQELNQLASAGIKAKAYLAEGLGYGTSDEGLAKLAKDLEGGAIGANQAIEMILEGMKEFDGMMDKTANETVEGLWGQITDTFEINIFRKWGQGLQSGAKKGFGTVVELLDMADDSLSRLGDTLYEVGENISNWVADKLAGAVERIQSITDTFEFKNASLKEKFSMLWRGLITDPLKEWWEGGGREKTAETAGEIGGWIGNMLTKGLLAIFGATEVLQDVDGTDVGGNIAGSFVQGFMQNFDGSAITDAFVRAISNVWDALPWWAKFLVGGYGGAKAMGGLASLAGGVASFIGTRGVMSAAGTVTEASGLLGAIGRTGAAGVGASGILGGLANAGYAMMGGTSALSMSGGMAALAGAGGIAGGVAGGLAFAKGVSDLFGSYRAFKEGDETEGKAKRASGTMALTGVAAGAAFGTAILPGVGTAIGAGIGGIAGWITGKYGADKIRESAAAIEDVTAATRDLETEEEKLEAKNKLIWQNMKDHMGDIKLSLSEIELLTKSIVWGDDLADYEQFASATKSAAESLKTLKSSAEDINKWMWKAGLGVQFDEDDVEAIAASFDSYMSSAKSYVENKHYEFTAAVSMLVDVKTEEGKGILESGNAFFSKLQGELDTLSKDLSGKLELALQDGIITLNEQEELTNLQSQIAAITEKLASAETKAELELIRLKFGKGNLDLDSFDNFMAQMNTTLSERIAANDEAFKASVSTLELELAEGAITEDQYNQQLQTLISGYTAKVDSIRAEVMDVELDIIGDAYAKELGENAKETLQTALEQSLADGINPAEWTTEQARQFLGIDSLSESTAGAIAAMLGNVTSQLELVTVDGKLMLQLSVETEEDPVNAVKGKIPDTVEKAVDVNITGKQNVTNTIRLLGGDFGIKNSYTFRPTVNISAVTGSVSPIRVSANSLAVKEFRGGIVGGSSALESFAQGGIVRGGSRLIEVAEEGSPEMIIPLSSQRRNRALKLWAQAGHMMDVPGFARGGLTGGGSDEGIRFHRYGSDESAGGQTVQVDVGGVTVEIHVDATGHTNIAEAIRQQGAEIAETVAGIMVEAFNYQYENTPTRGGAA